MSNLKEAGSPNRRGMVSTQMPRSSERGGSHKELAKQEVMEIMSNLKRCREAYDAIGAGLWAMKLESWRDAHPEEALAIVAELNRR